MKKVLTLGAAALVALSLAACSSSTSTKSTSSSKTSSSQQTKTGEKKVTRDAYTAIKLGDMAKSGNGGDTLATLEAKFGKATSSASAETNGIKTDTKTWTNVDGDASAAFVVSFVNGKAVGKNISHLKADRPKDITLAAYNKVTTGETYAAVNSALGLPNSINESIFSGSTSLIAVYLNKDLSSNATVTFANGKVQSKTQTNLK